MRVPTIFTHKKQTMRRKLFGYMLVLTLVLVCVIFAGLFLLGHYNSTKDKISDILALQMEVFEKEIISHQEALVTRSVHLSEDVTLITEHYLKSQNISFDKLENSQNHINNLQTSFVDLLSREIMQAECSGTFIVLNTTVNTLAENADTSKTGVYIQRNSVYDTDDTLLMYRGNPSVGKTANIMPHRKWTLEFDSKIFPIYDKLINTNPDIPLEKTYCTTDIVALPGTSEKVMLITIPIRSSEGETYGICGFEISSTIFQKMHSQPSTFEHLVCVFSKISDDNIINCDSSFTSGITNGYNLSPKHSLKRTGFGNNLSSFKDKNESYIGISRDIRLSFDDEDKHTISVMIPKYDYTQMQVKNIIQIVIFGILLLFFAVSCCGFLSKRYIAPVIKGLDKIKHSEINDSDSSTYVEIDDLFVFLGDKEKKLMEVQSKVKNLSYSRKNEIDPDDYEYFKTGVKTLTKQERIIFELYLSGKSATEILEITGIKERTLKFHNGNIYEKLGVHSRKQLLQYATIYEDENGGKL